MGVALLYDDVVITTCNIPFSCGSLLTDSRDSKTYQTVLIGSQCWMAENLNYDSGGGSFCYNNTPSNCTTYGRLYYWDAAMATASSSNLNPSGVQGVCPTGWHLPSDVEWCQMENAVEPETDVNCNTTGWRGTNTGKHLKTAAWGGDNTSGFSALPAGYYYNGTSYSMGTGAYFWPSTDNGVSYSWRRYLSSVEDGSYRKFTAKDYAYSVRCVVD